ncbi:MAG: hypothetical protein FJ145_07375 [Deltaproteobacteria bacterium]|nr:hypothetical protein [Deltaproteobacteria bacterium]
MLDERLVLLLAGAAIVYGCAPQRPYRTPPAPVPSAPQTVRVPPAPPPPPAAAEPARKTLPQEAKIPEQDLKRGTVPPSSSRESAKEPPSSVPENTAPPLPDNSSLLAKIGPGTSPQRAASLRLTEEGRRLLDAGDATKALTRLEQTIVIDSSNPYGYFYLAKAQHQLRRYRESLNFLDVAQARMGGDPFWVAEIHALRGDNFRALGMIDKAQSSYAQSLRLNSGNRTASDGLSRLQPADSTGAPH